MAEERGEAEPLPCAVTAAGDDAAALEASLIENIARLDPDEVTRWETFTRLVRKGRRPDDIATTFGLTDLQVRRTATATLTEIAHYWYVAEDRILRDPAIARPVNIIVYALDEVNQALLCGEYFWVDIARDVIALYELPCHPLATPMPLTPADAYQMAKG